MRELVVPAAGAIRLDQTLGEARHLLLRQQAASAALPVVSEDGGHLVGILTLAELDALPEGAAATTAAVERTCLRDLLRRLRVVYCFADSDLAEAAATMQAAEVSHLAVLGENDRLLGLLDRRSLPVSLLARSHPPEGGPSGASTGT